MCWHLHNIQYIMMRASSIINTIYSIPYHIMELSVCLGRRQRPIITCSILRYQSTIRVFIKGRECATNEKLG